MKYRKKVKYLLSPLLIVSLVFILYQLIMFIQLTSINEEKKYQALVLGIDKLRISYYAPTDDGKFQCISGRKEVIDYSQMNDNYCDCEDGSDEPGTNACSHGAFFCTTQTPLRGFKQIISTSMVNDGICDCCDGSDEYERKSLNLRLNDFLQSQIHKYMSPCVNFCP